MKLLLAVLLLILLLLQVRLWSGTGSLTDINRLEGEIDLQQADNSSLVERNEALRQEVEDLKNGLDSIEERARSQLGLVRKGETFVLVIDPEEAGATHGSGADPQAEADYAAARPFAPATVSVATDPALESGLDTLPPPVSSDERTALPAGEPVP